MIFFPSLFWLIKVLWIDDLANFKRDGRHTGGILIDLQELMYFCVTLNDLWNTIWWKVNTSIPFWSSQVWLLLSGECIHTTQEVKRHDLPSAAPGFHSFINSQSQCVSVSQGEAAEKPLTLAKILRNLLFNLKLEAKVWAANFRQKNVEQV